MFYKIIVGLTYLINLHIEYNVQNWICVGQLQDNYFLLLIVLITRIVSKLLMKCYNTITENCLYD